MKWISSILISLLPLSLSAQDNNQGDLLLQKALDSGIVQQIIERVQRDNPEVKFSVSEQESELSLNGSLYSVFFSRLAEEHVYGDLDQDGTNDAVVTVYSSAGGNTIHPELYVFVNREGKYLLKSIASSFKLVDCRAGTFIAERIENGQLIGQSLCFTEDDPRCCPSLKSTTYIQLQDGKLEFVRNEQE